MGDDSSNLRRVRQVRRLEASDRKGEAFYRAEHACRMYGRSIVLAVRNILEEILIEAV